MIKKLIFFVIQFHLILAHTPLVLITNLYNEKNPQRITEYITCLEKNIEHTLIDHIHVIYDTNGPENGQILQFLQENEISITYNKGRPTYGFCFDLANELYPECIILLTNADIYFNITLEKLIDYDLTNKFLALTRWNVTQSGQLAIHKWGKIPATGSQDVWIFKTPLKKFKKEDIVMGLRHCDIKIAYQGRAAGLKVFNPCLDIQCCHLHLSKIRNYQMKKLEPGVPVIYSLPWCHLQ